MEDKIMLEKELDKYMSENDLEEYISDMKILLEHAIRERRISKLMSSNERAFTFTIAGSDNEKGATARNTYSLEVSAQLLI